MNFKDKVHKVVSEISLGSFLIYAEVAKKAGSLGAYRAVGTALSKNRDFKKNPCHRVIKSDGKVGNYILGRDEKENRLRSEGVVIKKGKVLRNKSNN